MPVKYTHDEIVAMKDKLTNLTNKSTAEKNNILKISRQSLRFVVVI